MGQDDRKRDARVYVTAAEKRVIGKRSRAWAEWWKVYGDQPELLHTACLAAILSLGAPPHPEYLTADAAKTVPLPPRGHRNYRRVFAEEAFKQKGMWVWNRRMNKFAEEHRLTDGTYRKWAPAQFRKFFHAWLHACKEIENGHDE